MRIYTLRFAGVVAALQLLLLGMPHDFWRFNISTAATATIRRGRITHGRTAVLAEQTLSATFALPHCCGVVARRLARRAGGLKQRLALHTATFLFLRAATSCRHILPCAKTSPVHFALKRAVTRMFSPATATALLPPTVVFISYGWHSPEPARRWRISYPTPLLPYHFVFARIQRTECDIRFAHRMTTPAAISLCLHWTWDAGIAP